MLKYNAADEGLRFESFKLLSEDDLKELGFKMCARKLILQWIQAQHGAAASTSQPVFTPTPSSSSCVMQMLPTSGASASQSCPLVRLTQCQVFGHHASCNHSELYICTFIRQLTAERQTEEHKTDRQKDNKNNRTRLNARQRN